MARLEIEHPPPEVRFGVTDGPEVFKKSHDAAGVKHPPKWGVEILEWVTPHLCFRNGLVFKIGYAWRCTIVTRNFSRQ